MIKNIVKRNGKTEKFDAAKVNGWGEFAQDKFGGAIQWNGIVLDAVSSLPETCSSEDLQKALINGCANKATWEYNIMAGRLYSALTLKQLYGKTRPTLHALHKRMIADGSLVEMGYTDEEYKQLNKALDHKIELTYPHYRIKQIRERYALTKKLKNGGKIEYESSQFSYMRVAMAQMVNRPRETRVQDVIKLYGHLAAGRINVPTPFFKNSGTKLNAYTSCCTYNTDDNLKSLNAGDAIAYFMTAASAGIGCNIGSRSLGDLVRDGEIVHQGKIPYYRLLAELVKANIQSGRGGSATTFFSAFDPQVESLLMLMNPLTPKARQLRDIDYAFMSNGFFVDAVKNGSQIGLFSIHDAPDLYDVQFDKDTELFGKLYHEHMAKGTPFKMVNARDIAVQFMTQSVETGRIYQTFTDHLNTHTPFKDPIRTSNLCVHGDTKILTNEGYKTISKLAGTKQTVWNGVEWSEDVVVVKTASNQQLFHVVTDSGQFLKCTAEHKWYVVDEYGSKPREVRTHELKAGDKLIKFDLPVIEGDKELDKAYINGFYSGDGCETKGKQRIYLYGEKRKLAHLFGDVVWNHYEPSDRQTTTFDTLQSKFFVPDSGYTLKSRLDWLAGILDSDGCVYRNGSNEQLVLNSTNREFLQDIQLMLQTMGVNCKIRLGIEEGVRVMPLNDGSEGKGEFLCKAVWRMLITSVDVQTLVTLGLKTHRLNVEVRTPQRNSRRFVCVDSITEFDGLHDTYCFTEPKRHMGMFNGILTGQCLEIALPTEGYESVLDLYNADAETGEVGLCTIGGLNAAEIKDDEQYAECAYYSLLMIDNAISNSSYEFPHVAMTARKRMNAAVGLVGVAHWLAKQHLNYTTQKGRDAMYELGETHYWHLVNASLKISKERGVAEWMHKTKWIDGWLPIDTYCKEIDNIVTVGRKRDWEGLRKQIIANGGIGHSVLCAHMPAETSSVATGSTNGLYPIRDFTLMKSTNDEANFYVVPDSTELRWFYDIAWDVPAEDLIKCYGIFQAWTDQAISADLYSKVEADEKISARELLKIYLLCYKYGLKTRYYFNTRTGKDVFNMSETDGCGSGGCKL